jgi:hypothetical protein
MDTETHRGLDLMNRLTRSARGLLVALAALALTGGAVFAARSLPLPDTSGTQQAATQTGRTLPVAGGAPATEHGAPDADETAEPAETPDTEDSGAAANADRPHNHGWFVSQAAQAETPAGFDNHGAYVSSIARGDAGKTGAATIDASPSAAGKAKAAAARDKHQH